MKQFFFILFTAMSFGAFAQPVANCSMMCVLDIQIDTSTGLMEVTLFSGDTNHINYPTIQVIDVNGDTVGNPAGTFVFFAHPQGTMTHEITTTLTTLPQPFNCTVLVTDQVWDTTCYLTYPMSCPMNIVSPDDHKAFEVYPNPASDVLTIMLPGSYSGKAKVGLSNTLGEVFSGTMVAHNGKIDMDVNDLACGVYFVTVTIDDKQYMQRFIRK
jgi:hypothetical protein